MPAVAVGLVGYSRAAGDTEAMITDALLSTLRYSSGSRNNTHAPQGNTILDGDPRSLTSSSVVAAAPSLRYYHINFKKYKQTTRLLTPLFFLLPFALRTTPLIIFSLARTYL